MFSRRRLLTLRHILASILDRVAETCTKLSRALYLPLNEQRVNPWLAVQGDRTLRLNYELTDKDTVFDLGGYEGQWASDIFAMYGCSIHIFEPVPQFAEGISKRFARNRRVFVHRFGLSDKDQAVKIY